MSDHDRGGRTGNAGHAVVCLPANSADIQRLRCGLAGPGCCAGVAGIAAAGWMGRGQNRKWNHACTPRSAGDS